MAGRKPTHVLWAVVKEDKGGETVERWIELAPLWKGETALSGTLHVLPAPGTRIVVKACDALHWRWASALAYGFMCAALWIALAIWRAVAKRSRKRRFRQLCLFPLAAALVTACGPAPSLDLVSAVECPGWRQTEEWFLDAPTCLRAVAPADHAVTRDGECPDTTATCVVLGPRELGLGWARIGGAPGTFTIDARGLMSDGRCRLECEE